MLVAVSEPEESPLCLLCRLMFCPRDGLPGGEYGRRSCYSRTPGENCWHPSHCRVEEGESLNQGL